jgi:hypothetical protein
MKPVHWLAVARVALASLLPIAQLAGAGAQQNTSAAASGSQGSGSATADGAGGSQISAHDLALAARYLRPVSAVLESKLDSRTAKPGDRVVVRTTRGAFLADGTEIPKGSQLVGHVTQAEAHSKDRQESQLSFTLDRVELKYGINVAIHATIQSVAPPPAGEPTAGSMGADDSFGRTGSMAAGDASMTGDGPVAGVARNTGRVGGQVDSPPAGTLGATDGVSGNTGGPVDRTLASNGEGAFSTAKRPTEVPGVMLRGYIVGSASGTLSAAGKDVRLDSGTQMLLGVAAK